MLLAYEGGQHLVGIGNVQNNQSITNLFIAANRDPRMGDMYLKLLDNWRNSGGGLFMHYANISSAGQYGSWGAIESMGQETSPKYDALIQFIVANPQ